jgi:hypothetical protein
VASRIRHTYGTVTYATVAFVGRVIGIWRGEDGRVRSGPAVRNDAFVPVLDLIRSKGLLDRPLLTPRCRDRDHADQVRKSIYLAARYYCSCGERMCTRKHNNIDGCPDEGQRLSVRCDVVKDSEGRLRVQVQVFDKKESMRAVVQRYGSDPSAWPYQSRAKKIRSK